MRFTENVHYRVKEYRVQQFNSDRTEYCYWAGTGVARIVESIHPEVFGDNLKEIANYLHKTKNRKRLASGDGIS